MLDSSVAGVLNTRLPEQPRRRLAGAVAGVLGAIPPPGLLLLSIISIQVGAALAVHLFPALGPTWTVFLRVGFSAVLLTLIARPLLDGAVRSHAGLLLLFGFIIAAMNLCFYHAIARIPLGIAVTIEFIGPLGVAVATSRRPVDFLWIALAVIGIGMLSPEFGQALDPLGVLFAVLAAVGWAGFIFVSGRVGRAFSGSTGLALGMAVAALFLLPATVASGGSVRIEPAVLVGALAVAVLSTAIPFSLEFEALKRLPPRMYGVLVSLEPAVAVMVGVILLDEAVGLQTLLAVSLVTTAAPGVTISYGKGSGP